VVRRCNYEGALTPALRRVNGVRVIVGAGPTRAEVYGIGHRHPATITVSLGLAARLVRAGAPLKIQTGAAVRPVEAALR
jgi:hypothetical protein